jgi:hypothetical protein
MLSLQNAEIFTLTYGSIVRQLITDLDDIDLVNKQLDAMWDKPSPSSATAPSSLTYATGKLRVCIDSACCVHI